MSQFYSRAVSQAAPSIRTHKLEALCPRSCADTAYSQVQYRGIPRIHRSGFVPKRLFSSSFRRRATAVLQNPRADEDGKDMIIEISDRAAKQLQRIVKAPARKNTLTQSNTGKDSHLRITVTSGGCHGFQYLMALEGADKIDHEEDTIFASSADADGARAEVVMDEASLELLKGSTVDYTTELIGSQFKIVGNPRAKSSCGCGTSFDID